jgi:hypothetical protein
MSAITFGIAISSLRHDEQSAARPVEQLQPSIARGDATSDAILALTVAQTMVGHACRYGCDMVTPTSDSDQSIKSPADRGAVTGSPSPHVTVVAMTHTARQSAI